MLYKVEALKKEIYKLKPMWERELMPEEWKEAVTVPLQKKGDKQICSNYREISLLNKQCTKYFPRFDWEG